MNRRIPVFFFILLLLATSAVADSEILGTSRVQETVNGILQQRIQTLDPSVPVQPIPDFFNNFELDEYGEELWSDSDPTGIMNYMDISDDGSIIVVGVSLNNDRMIVYDGETGDTLYQFTSDNEGFDVCISGNGNYIGCTNSRYFNLLTSESNTPVWTYDAGDGYRSYTADINYDGSLVVVAGLSPTGEDYWVSAFNSESNTPLWTQTFDPSLTSGWYGVTISGDGSIVAVNGKYHAYLLDTDDGSVLWDFDTNNTESPVRLSDDGSVVTTGSLSGGRFRVFNYDPGQETWVLLWDYVFTGGTSNWVSATAVSADGSTVAAGSLTFMTGGYGGQVVVFDTYSGPTPLWTPVDIGDMVEGLAISEDGYTIAAASWGDLNNAENDVCVFEKYSGEAFFGMNHPGSANGLAMTPDGTRLITGGKAVHNRQMGNGGTCYAILADLEGGTINGTVTLSGEVDHSGVIVETADGHRSTLTDEDGMFTLHNVPAGTTEVVARKLGWTTATQTIVVSDGQVVNGVTFQLSGVDDAPENLSATQGDLTSITLTWDAVTLMAQWRSEQDRLYATGDVEFMDMNPLTSRSMLNPVHENTPPELDELDEADSIRVWRSAVSGGPYVPVTTIDGDLTTYTDETDLFPTRTYYYVVTAVFENGESEYSNEATGFLDDSYLIYNATIPEMTAEVTFDGVISNGEWDDAFRVDISDVFGYDIPNAPETAYLMMKYDEENDLLVIATEDYSASELVNGVGVGFYVDDDGNGAWTRTRSGSEGNYWAYYYTTGPSLRYRSLSGAPYNSSPYYTFEDPDIGFSDASGHVTCEFAIPMGFRGEYELALYGPDRTPGIGVFTLNVEANTTLFTGWWPQNIASIVSNPEQFAPCVIEADLLVPPAAPAEVEVSRINEGEAGVEITWTDPIYGIDDLPLDNLAGIEIYRNNEHMATVDPEVQSYQDLTGKYGGWFEYSVAGYVLDEENDPFEGPTSAAVGAYNGEDPTIEELVYDDGSYETFYIVGGTDLDNQFTILYDRPADVIDEYLDQQELYTVTLMVNSSNPIGIGFENNYFGYPTELEAGPYWVTPPVALEWFTFHFAGSDRPILESEQFWIRLEWDSDSPSSPGIATDTNGEIYNRCYWYNTDNGWVAFTGGNYMVRAGAGWSIFLEDGIEEESAVVHEFNLGANYPNPFNPETVIPFELANAGDARLEVFNTLGQKVATLVQGAQRAGHHVAIWKGHDDFGTQVASGMYLVRLSSGSKTATERILLLR